MTVREPDYRRTDPKGFIVRAVMMLAQLVIPLGLAAVTFSDDGDFSGKLAFAVPIIAAMILFNTVIAYLQWTKLTYTVGTTDIRVESGVLSRAARSVPYERIQDVSLEQKLLPRLFGLVEVKFETGAGGKDDLSLTYLSESEGERLRELVRNRREGAEEASEPGTEKAPEQADTIFAMGPKRVFTFGLFEFSLAVVAVIGGLAQQLEFLLPFDLWDVGEWEQRLAGPGQWLAGLGPLAQVAGIIIAVAMLAVLGVATGLVRTALREWDFRLERTAKGLRRRRGLLTRTDLVMPLHRVQALRLNTGFVRRLFGWHSLKIISLASDSGGANHDAVPFGQMDEIQPVVGVTGFELPPAQTNWQRAMPEYRIDKAVLAVLVLIPVTAVVAVIGSAWFWLLPAAGLVFTLAEQWWRWKHDFRALGERQVYSRHGWFSPSLAIGSRVKLQSVDIRQGPLARLRGYASLHFGLAGGRLRIHGMPIAEARRWRDEISRSISSADFSELLETKGAPAT
ncbi:PH domain-containing protein [Qipengyuania sp. 1XM1-15A]|uniref:PH domain-containing protein n=1 Tax=Qipengyuania xiamenensis TaxID=2867237 RepID=UPI001C86B2A8|nr:PH domain-containing protein [Qipengyuania xiamenensis]MBX7533876.1 PH domain-containing protein [Qipengyuania xiamenensis]